MSYLKAALVPYFMNQLTFSLRDAAKEFYLNGSLDSLIDMRVNQVTNQYKMQYGFTKNQWAEIIDAVILTRLSMLDLKLLSAQELETLHRVMFFALSLKTSEWDFLYKKLAVEAPQFLKWATQLRKLLGYKND